MPLEEENCQQLITITEEDIQNSVRVIPRLDTLILIKAMGHRRRFCNPFRERMTSTDTAGSKASSTNGRPDNSDYGSSLFARKPSFQTASLSHNELSQFLKPSHDQEMTSLSASSSQHMIAVRTASSNVPMSAIDRQ